MGHCIHQCSTIFLNSATHLVKNRPSAWKAHSNVDTCRPAGATFQGRFLQVRANVSSIDCPATDNRIRVLRNEDSGVSSPTPLLVVVNSDSPSQPRPRLHSLEIRHRRTQTLGPSMHLLRAFCEHADPYMIYCSTSRGNLGQTRLGLAIGIPLGVIILLGLTVFVMIRRRRGRQNSFVPGAHILPMSQHRPTGTGRGSSSSKRFVSSAATPPTAPASPIAPTVLLESSVASAPDSPLQLGRPHLDTGSSALGSVEAPPPYRSP